MSTVALKSSARTAQPATLRDGGVVKVREIRLSDRAELRSFLDGVSSDALFLRFFGTPSLDRTADALAARSPSSYGLIVQPAGSTEIIAHGAWFRTGPERAEIAFLVTDAWQGRGVGSILCRRLAEAAQRSGIATLTAEVMTCNQRMIAIFQGSGYAAEVRATGDGLRVRLPISDDPPGLAHAA